MKGMKTLKITVADEVYEGILETAQEQSCTPEMAAYILIATELYHIQELREEERRCREDLERLRKMQREMEDAAATAKQGAAEQGE